MHGRSIFAIFTIMKRTVQRYDTGTIESVDSGDGFLRARVTIARDGVFPYLYSDGSISLEVKKDVDLFSEMTINSAKGVPVVDGHPPIEDNNGLINSKNYNKYVKGALGDTISVKDGKLDSMETIFDADLIRELKAGKKLEVSIGLETDMDYTPGIYKGEKYDAAQTNIRINHVAHVEKGRAGNSVRAHLDSAIRQDIAVMHINKNNKGNNMGDENKGKDAEVNALLEGFKKLFAMLTKSSVETSVDAKDAEKPEATTPPVKTDSSDLERIIKIQAARIDALEAVAKKRDEIASGEITTSRLDAAINERLNLVEIASSVVKDFKRDGLDNRDIKLKVIEQMLPFPSGTKMDSIDDVVIDARFDAASELARQKANIDESSSKPKFDQSDINALREKRQNMIGGE
ncbi:MAG: DUF2213 domain-containing protein [Campylobacterales bacterium]|nr:DUF2213 domain-containing protein [Campylobacterales bacterium]